MKPIHWIALVLALVLCVGFSLPASGQSAGSATPSQLTPEQRANIREKLKSLIDELKTVTYEKNSSLTSLFMKASESSRSAVAYYLACIEDVDFTRAGLGGSEFRQWKEKNERRLDSDDFARALQIQLKYLAISTEAARTDDIAKVFPLLTGYIDSIASMEEVPHPLLSERISQSIFARRYDLFEDRERERERGRRDNEEEKETWELRPLNIGGMYEKTILPYLHENTPEKVISAWTKRIEHEARMATVRGDAAEEQFRRETYPSLQWDMYTDQFKVGYEVDGAAKMLEHIETHKGTHPKVPEWVEEMIALVYPDTDSTYKKEAETPAG